MEALNFEVEQSPTFCCSIQYGPAWRSHSPTCRVPLSPSWSTCSGRREPERNVNFLGRRMAGDSFSGQLTLSWLSTLKSQNLRLQDLSADFCRAQQVFRRWFPSRLARHILTKIQLSVSKKKMVALDIAHTDHPRRRSVLWCHDQTCAG